MASLEKAAIKAACNFVLIGTIFSMTHSGKNKEQISTKIRARGRPRAFDPVVAVDAAQSAFLRKGYAATTLDDLSEAMSINRPSLYGAFGSKEDLYIRALQAYADRMATLFAAALREATFSKALKKLYATALDAYVADDGAVVGCMVAITAVAEAVEEDGIRAQAKAIMDGIDQLVAQRISRAIAEGELSGDVKARALSRLIVGVLHSLAVRARAGTSRKVLDEMADDAVRLLAHSKPPLGSGARKARPG